MMQKKIYFPFLLMSIVLFSSYILFQNDQKPTLYFIGDSTVKNGKGDGGGGLWGWADFMKPHFDSTKINIQNNALGGTSSRTFQTQGLWNKVLDKLKAGDYVMIQFGHNDTSPINDSTRARGTIKGVGEDTVIIENILTKKTEIVHTYGWYLTKFITDIQAKGATAIVCSPVPRNGWKNGKVNRNEGNSYGGWAKQVATKTNSYFIDLNAIIADQYDALGEESIKAFFPKDNTHTGKDGAILNAASVITGLKSIPNCSLNKYLLSK